MTVVQTLPLPDEAPVLSSGEIGNDVVETIRVIEAAVRRCGKSTALLTAEDLDTAKTNLHLILSALSNRGVNLWAVDRQLVPLVRGQSQYTLPLGTEKIVNIMYRTAKRMEASSVVVQGQSSLTVNMFGSQNFNMVGFQLVSEHTGDFVMEYRGGVDQWQEYRRFDNVTLSAGWHWYAMDPGLFSSGFRIRRVPETDLMHGTDMMLCNSATDRDVSRMNRDHYTSISDKMRPGRPNSYFFDKQLEAKLILWPVPEDDTAQIILWRQRRIHDVGSLSSKLELPERWLESITWTLAKNLAFELPGVTPERIALCATESVNALRDAELGESDQAPMYIQPNISGYTA